MCLPPPPTCSATACLPSVHINLHVNSVDRCELSPDVLRVWTQEWYVRLLSQTNCDLAPWCRTSQPPGRHKGRYQPAALPSPRPSSEGGGGTIFSSTTAASPGLMTRQELSATCSPYIPPSSKARVPRNFHHMPSKHLENPAAEPQLEAGRSKALQHLLNNQSLHHWPQIEESGRQLLNCKAWCGRSDTGSSVAETVSSSGSDSRVACLHWEQHLASFPSGYPERRKAMGHKRKWNITTFPVLCDVLVFGGHHGNETLTPAASLCSQMTADFQKQQQQRHISLPYLTDNHSCLKPRPVLVVSIKRHEAIFAACTSMCHMTAPSFLLLPDR